MIVLCNACHARFRVADDKVGPRGVKVRCSKCQNVFVVQRDPAAAGFGAPPPGPGVPPAATSKTVEFEVPAEEPGRTSSRSLASAPVPVSVAAADPFERSDPFARTASEAGAAADDPFAMPSSPPLAAAPAPEPFSASQPAIDPFAPAPTSAADPFAPVPAAAAEAFAPSIAPPEPGSCGLALEDAEPARADAVLAAPGSADFAGVDPFAGAPEIAASTPGLDLDGTAPVVQSPPPMPPPLPSVRQRTPVPEAAIADVAAEAPEAAPLRPAPPPPASPGGNPKIETRLPRRSESRLRTLAVNSVSLAALLLVTVGLLAVWRGDRAGVQAPRSRALLSLFGLAAEASAAPLVATHVTNGLYETARGRPLLFVRGQVRSRSGAAGAIRVRVEIVDDDRVVGTAEGIAGVLPTPEELWGVASRSDLEKLERALARRERPGNDARELPFLVVFADYPTDLSGLAFRVAPQAGGG